MRQVTQESFVKNTQISTSHQSSVLDNDIHHLNNHFYSGQLIFYHQVYFCKGNPGWKNGLSVL